MLESNLTSVRCAGLSTGWDGNEFRQGGLGCSCSARFTQILFVLPSELPRVMDIALKVHDFDFVAFIQRRPELVFTEQWFRFHCLLAFVADCLYGLHVSYATLAVRATQEKRTPSQLSKSSAWLGPFRFLQSYKC